MSQSIPNDPNYPAVQLDQTKMGVRPYRDSSDPTENYNFMSEFAKWVLTSDESQALEALKLRVLDFYLKLKTSQADTMDVPSYNDYLALVDAYNVDRGYGNEKLRPFKNDIEQLTAMVQKLIANQNSSTPQRPRLRDRFAGWMTEQRTPMHSATQTPSQQPPAKPVGEHF